ncbi:MAG TPA: hypothetical protein VMY42_02870 [Thermoguttaceae bacterium]|nr:hypothetical protein [Thermoguttaceae bacterium]
MAAPKRKRFPSSSEPGLRKLIRFLWGPGRTATLMVLLIAVLLGGWCAAWSRVRDYVLSSDDYTVTPEQLEITPLPKWIHSDIPAEVFRNASLDGPLSIMDDDLTKRIAEAFASHPWVAKVHRVTKRHPACVQVELDYRRPVCMVQLAGRLLPVDARGVLLPPGDFSPVEISRYLRLIDVHTTPMGTVGECWGDARVIGGAAVAAALEDVQEELNLSHIVPCDPLRAGFAEECTYTLVTRGGAKVSWGRAPGTRAPGEPTPKEKIARLKEYAAKHGTLDGRGAPQELDVNLMSASS